MLHFNGSNIRIKSPRNMTTAELKELNKELEAARKIELEKREVK